MATSLVAAGATADFPVSLIGSSDAPLPASLVTDPALVHRAVSALVANALEHSSTLRL